MKEVNIKIIIEQFIRSVNAFDIPAAMELFAHDAVIDDVSVGEKFKDTAGVQKYLKQFFIGYKTVTKIVSVEVVDKLNAKARVDFTGDFGHETGALNFTINSAGFIKTIDAYLD